MVRNMKKYVLMLLAVLMVFGSTMTTFASSVTVDSVVTVESAVDKNGVALGVRVEQVSDEIEKLAQEATTEANLKALLGNAYSADLRVVDVLEVAIFEDGVKLTDEEAQVYAPFKARFKMPASQKTDNVQILQLIDGKWYRISSVVYEGNGLVTGTFEHVGPVVFLANGFTGTGSEGDSPVTGDNNGVFALVGLMAVAVGASVVVLKRRAK